MILAIDVGNTNLVFALVRDGDIKARWRIATDPRRTADQYSVWLHQLLELEGLSRDDVEGVIIGTVVPRALHNLQVLSEKYFRKTPIIAGQGAAAWPLQLDVDEPQNVGADRALNAIAAHAGNPVLRPGIPHAQALPQTARRLPACRFATPRHRSE